MTLPTFDTVKLVQEKSHNKTAATKTGRRLASTDAWPEPFKKTEKKRFDKKKESPSCELEASAAQSTSIRPGAEVGDGSEAAEANRDATESY